MLSFLKQRTEWETPESPHPQCTRVLGLLSDGALTAQWICLHPSAACGGDSRAVSETLRVASPSLALAVSFLLFVVGIQGQKYTLSLSHTHTHTRREGSRRSRTPKCGPGFKHAQAVLGEVSQLGWEHGWHGQAGRGREQELSLGPTGRPTGKKSQHVASVQRDRTHFCASLWRPWSPHQAR